MSVIIPPGFGEASIYISGPDGTPPYVTTIGLDLSAAGGDFVAVANWVGETYAGQFTDLMSDIYAVDHVLLAVGQDGGSTPSVSSTFEPQQGSLSSGEFEPVSMACIMRKESALLGRKGRGRMFLPCILHTSAVGTNGRISDAFRTTARTAGGTWLGHLQSGDPDGVAVPPVILHTDSTVDPTPMTNVSISPIVGWIRKRVR